MATDVTNILIGPGRIYTAPVGTAPPDENDNLLDWTGWTEVGYTDGGVEFAYTPEIFDAFVDQELGPVRTQLIGEQFVVRVPIAEADLRNLNKAIAGSTLTSVVAGAGVTGKDILTFGSGTLKEQALGFEAESPESQGGAQGWRLVLVWRTVSRGEIGHAYRKGEKTMIPVEFSALVDQSKAIGQRLARFVDWTAAAS